MHVLIHILRLEVGCYTGFTTYHGETNLLKVSTLPTISVTVITKLPSCSECNMNITALLLLPSLAVFFCLVVSDRLSTGQTAAEQLHQGGTVLLTLEWVCSQHHSPFVLSECLIWHCRGHFKFLTFVIYCSFASLHPRG